MTRYRTKPVEVQAWQFTGDNEKDAPEWVGKLHDHTNDRYSKEAKWTDTVWLGGYVFPGDWFVRTDEVECYSDQEFRSKFEPILNSEGI